MEIDKKRTAVMGLHWMPDVVHPTGKMGGMFGAAVEKSGITKNAAKLFDGARKAGTHFAYTRIVFQPGYVDMIASAPLYHGVRASGGMIDDGSPGVGIIEELKPHAGDIVVGHNRVSGFAGTSLDAQLRARNIDTLVLTGVSTNITVEGTARHASDLGYRVIIASDCCISNTAEAHEASLATLAYLAEIATHDQILAAL